MVYRAYLIDKSGARGESTETCSPRVIAEAFRELLERDDLAGQPVLAVLERDGAELLRSDYARPPGEGRIHPLAPLDVYAKPECAAKALRWRPHVL